MDYFKLLLKYLLGGAEENKKFSPFRGEVKVWLRIRFSLQFYFLIHSIWKVL
jgi:hypothetical protein